MCIRDRCILDLAERDYLDCSVVLGGWRDLQAPGVGRSWIGYGTAHWLLDGIPKSRGRWCQVPSMASHQLDVHWQ
eukprot:1445630-Amphidinium_carterae.1